MLEYLRRISYFILVVACLCGFSAHAQNDQTTKELEGQLQKASRLLESHRYNEAIQLAKGLLAANPSNPEVNLIIGLGYINLGDQADSSVYFLLQGMTLLREDQLVSETGINLQLSLGKAYQMALKPQRGLEVYSKLLGLIPAGDSVLIQEVTHEAQTCENAKLYLDNPIALKITNMGDNVNSSFDDHTPLLSITGDKLIYTSRRKHENLTLLYDGQYAEKICVSFSVNGSWDKSRLFNTFYKKNDHESAVSVSADGKQMFLFKNDPDGKNLYYTKYNNNIWGEATKLPEPINSYSNETHCSMSADGSTLFFTSDREGGLGGLDIYMCKKLTNGVWGDARNLGPNINTAFNEETPMVYLDGKTLYFASEGHGSMGMFDIFYAQMNADSTWTEPVNLGYPINSPGDDMFFVPTIERTKAYYSTAQFADNKGGMDIYLVEFDPHFEGKLAVVEGKVNQGGEVKSIRILVSRAHDQKLVGDYRPDPVTGEYVMFLETGYRYEIKQVLQRTQEVVVGEITVGPEMAFEEARHPVKLTDVDIEPPLSPAERVLAQVNLEEKIAALALPNTQLAQIVEIPFAAADVYTVQLLALRTSRLRNYKIFKGLDLKKITEYVCKDGFYRYTYSQFENREASLAERRKLISDARFKDAFVRPAKQLAEMQKLVVLEKP